jgi:putative DNA primase/helicase
LPEALNDRAQDNWEHLFAISDIAGAHWPRKAKQAALSLSGVEAEEPSQSILLLADIRDVFDATGEPSIRSSDLVAALVAMPERPWGECNHGKALTQNSLARRLKPFGVRTGKVGPEAKRAAGYSLESFADPFSRYIPRFSTGQSDISSKINELCEKQTGQPNNECPVENRANMLNSHGVSGCPVEKPLSGEREGNGDAVEAQGLAAQGLEAAKRGHDWLSAFWAELTPDEREAVGTLSRHCSPPYPVQRHTSGWTSSMGADQRKQPEHGDAELRVPHRPHR